MDKAALIKQLDIVDKSADREWITTLEERKIKELEFHNRYRDAGQKGMLSKSAHRKIYGNKRFYTITRSSNDYADKWIAAHTGGKVFLDYACGNGVNTIKAAGAGAELAIGIDISDISVKNARNSAIEEGLAERTYFVCGDCEKTGFPDRSVDVILCAGVLHHLEPERAFTEMRRILKPGGRVLIIEALGYNPIIKLYRYITPEMRTKWEAGHVISYKDINLARKFFEVSDIRHWHLFGIAGAYFPFALPFFDMIDAVALRIPFIKMMSWMITLQMQKRG